MQQEVMDVGNKLVDLCKRNETMKAVETLYSPNIESIEAEEMPNFPSKMKGLDSIKAKNEKWARDNEVHSVDVLGPFPAGDRFAVVYKWDSTHKPTNKRMKFEEVALYSVKDGKIVKEEFFYKM